MFGYLVTNSVGAFKSFRLKNGGGVGLESECGDTSEDGVSVEELDSFENLLAGVTRLEEVDGVLTEEQSLVLVSGELADRGERS